MVIKRQSRRKAALNILAIGIFGVVVSLSACNRPWKLTGDPKDQLTEYISLSFAVKSEADKKALLQFLTGKARDRLSAWSSEQFSSAFLESKREFVKLVIKEVSPLTPDRVNVTYELTYLDQTRGSNAKVTNKKLCILVREQGRWLISDVQNIKELVEFRNELSLP